MIGPGKQSIVVSEVITAPDPEADTEYGREQPRVTVNVTRSSVQIGGRASSMTHEEWDRVVDAVRRARAVVNEERSAEWAEEEPAS